MRELSLHILEVIERAIRSGASIISVNIMHSVSADFLEVQVEDNGSGLDLNARGDVSGLDEFRATAEHSGGGLKIEKSELGGVAIKARMKLNQLNGQRIGDLAATLSSVVCTNPSLDLWCKLSSDEMGYEVRVSEVARELQVTERCGLAIARRVSEKIRKGLAGICDRATSTGSI